MDLQSALLAIQPALTSTAPAAPKPKTKPKAKPASQPRRLAVGSFDCGRKMFDTTGEFNRPDPSRPPQAGMRSNWPSIVGAAAYP